jgi:DNA-binding transcriptional ArsR family regulator
MELAAEANEGASAVFDQAAAQFGVLAIPVRLRIIGELCASERNVSHLLDAIEVSQPNMSRHLSVLHQAGIVSKRKSGANVIYALANDSMDTICRIVCTQVVTEVAAGHR